MEVRTRNNNGAIETIYGTIATANVKDKILEFRNALNLAYLEDYGNIEGIGGSKHAVRSGIRMIIQDNTGQSAFKNLDAIIPTYVIEQMYQVCKDNLYAPKDPKAVQSGSRITGLESVPTNVLTLTNAFSTLLSGCVQASANIVLKKGNDAGPVAEFGAALKKAKAAMKVQAQDLFTNAHYPYTEYAYHQDRLNTYKTGQDGYCPYTTCDIKREQYRTDNQGAKVLSKNPWNFVIATKEVVPVVDSQKGTSYPKPGTARNEKKLFVNISDSEMYRCLYRVSRFIDIWEYTYGIPLVRAGIAQAEVQRQNYMQAGNNNYSDYE